MCCVQAQRAASRGQENNCEPALRAHRNGTIKEMDGKREPVSHRRIGIY